jgi:hypothetical protein
MKYLQHRSQSERLSLAEALNEALGKEHEAQLAIVIDPPTSRPARERQPKSD